MEIMGDKEGEASGVLAEFAALRQEIERRNIVQHALFALQLTSAGAIFSFALSDESRARFLLIVPISTYRFALAMLINNPAFNAPQHI
jgi:hypothetical protein